ncbi:MULTISPECIES: RluA family pseudouridine synthase [unclassified Candidatus Frackibacter]|uniref:RluA family pseudouridine synthase n=1 Tax=unclassified Candidatus Frackibacter TaxID=2648818 RepID=UPI0008924C20|nr:MULTISPECIES: RluA family pseudouridine synthase [unclassified Candidatus Frackibacter]SDC48253.1 ribosomal large subunit pseudouridine synthase D [Candidatus Frackibacter sp. WG11]SEM95515.1 ribosomal large subunit pseudouridine synthase D [Candidatus Frackibacter sp. WG12]SFL73428.1 ribosomal large subunit pseudouridine synthase D [Candidatus Frackibacter sp. WG13]
MAEEMNFIINDDDVQQRLDKFLAGEVEDISRTYVQELIDQEEVTVNGSGTKSSYRLQLGDEVELNIPEPEKTELEPEEIPLNIIYEDEDIVVINKQADLVVHPAPGHESGTLVNALLYHCNNLSGISGEVRPGIVHRLDKDTTGVMVVAKNNQAHLNLSQQFKDRETEKRYLTLVEGNIKHNKGKIDAAIGRDPKDRKKMAVTSSNSKKAVTRFEILERFGDYTWVEVKLETGRTHQIRVHMSYLGNPIVGDETYGYRNSNLGAKRQLLHAYRLGFEHPTKNEWMEFEAELPQDMQGILESLRNT